MTCISPNRLRWVASSGNRSHPENHLQSQKAAPVWHPRLQRSEPFRAFCYQIGSTSCKVLLGAHLLQELRCFPALSSSFAQCLSFIHTRRSPVLRRCFDRGWGGGEERKMCMCFPLPTPSSLPPHRHQLLPIKHDRVRLGSPLQALQANVTSKAPVFTFIYIKKNKNPKT